MKMYFERNIKLHYVISSLMWGRFFIPVIALFFIASQVSLEQFTIIMSVFALATLLFEIPSGAVTDLLGKKNILLLSRFLYLVEIALIAFFDGFLIFLIAKIISGVAVSFTSGASESLVYDSLKRLKREKDYKKVAGLANTISNISMVVVFITGSYLFTIYYKLPALASLPLVFIGFILTFFITEPYNSKTKITVKNSVLQMAKGLKYFKNNYYLKYLALFTFIMGSTIAMMLNLSSKYFELILIPVASIGLISFFMSLTTAYSSKKAHDMEVFLGEKNSIIYSASLLFLAVLLSAFLFYYIGVIFLFIVAFVSGFYHVLIGDYVNKHVTTSTRATMLSVNNMFSNIGVFLIFPAIGFLGEEISFSFSLFFLSALIFICLTLLIYFYKK
ncbi:MAG: MFS transporter [Candidatus Woesearchaeota archaeon]